MREDFASEQIAERFFSSAEQQTLQELPREQRQQAFFYCWTRKEAYVKGTGGGLFQALNQFDVSVVPSDQCALRATRPDPADAKRWEIRDLKTFPGYVAALAVESIVPDMNLVEKSND